MNEEIIVLVLGGGTNALGQIRAAVEAGYTCVNLVEDCLHKYSAKSNKCTGIIAPHPTLDKEKCLKFTIDYIKNLPSKPFLFTASDDWMNMIGENEDKFLEIAHIVQSNWSDTEKLYNKKYLYRLAEENGIPYPKTLELSSLRNLDKEIESITFPCVMKPQLTVDQNEVKPSKLKLYHRTQTFGTKQEALSWAQTMLEEGLDFPVLLQEYIPGDATNLYTLTSYSDKEGNLIAGSIGYKLRQFPPEAGRITSGVLHYDERLKDTGERFLKTIGYHGVANTEFKYDKRDGKYKLMEINTRFGAWNYSALYSGLNLMKIAIDDYLGRKYYGPMFIKDKDEHIWYNFVQDFGGSVILCRKPQFKKHRLGIKKWWKSLGRNHIEGVFDAKDMKPFFYSCFYTVIDMIKK